MMSSVKNVTFHSAATVDTCHNLTSLSATTMSFDIPSPLPMEVTSETTLSDIIEATILDGHTQLDDLLDMLCDSASPLETTHSETSTTRPYSETTTTSPYSETTTSRPHSETTTTRPHSETSTTRPHSETSTTHINWETSTTRPYSETTTTRPHSETSTTHPHCETITTRPLSETTTTSPHSETSTTHPHCETNTTRPHSETNTTHPYSETTTIRPYSETTTTHPRCENSTTRPYSENTTTRPNCDNDTYHKTTPLKKSTTASSPISESRHDSIFGLLSSPPSTPLLNHPFFCELRSVLLDECKKSATPNSLLSTFQPKSYSTVSDRERRLQQMFKRQHSAHGDEIQQLSSFYRYQAGAVEMERLQNLQDSAPTYHPSVNSYYDNQLHLIMDRVETSLEGLDTTTRESEPLSAPTRPLSRPVLSRKAVRLMEEWFYLNTEHPYPSPDVIHRLAEQGHVKEEQVKKWFSNKRSRTHNTKTLAEISKRRRRPQGPPRIIYLPSFDYC